MRTERLYRTEAVVLRRQDFGEADRVITFYSPTIGKFRAIAKGVRRPKSRLGGNVELFTHVNLLVAQGRNLDLVTQAEAARTFGHIRDDLWVAAYACYVAELVDRFTEERLENHAIFDLLLQAFTYLDSLDALAAGGAIQERRGEGAPEVELAMRHAELQLLGALGYAPELFRCVHCGEALVPAEHRFSAAGGGVLCSACSYSQPSARAISVTAIKAMRLMSREPFGVFKRLRLPPEVAQEMEGALRSHVAYLLERHLRTSEFLDRLKADHQRERRAARAAHPATGHAPDAVLAD